MSLANQTYVNQAHYFDLKTTVDKGLLTSHLSDFCFCSLDRFYFEVCVYECCLQLACDSSSWHAGVVRMCLTWHRQLHQQRKTPRRTSITISHKPFICPSKFHFRLLCHIISVSAGDGMLSYWSTCLWLLFFLTCVCVKPMDWWERDFSVCFAVLGTRVCWNPVKTL